ncbi:S16 family serine protease [Paenibacillus enshidis]|uniref:S16 family serine protease n=1 Tax=Paenibacillus enshidis TaxID=1458439 RepID=A0ABV5AZD3_9BACL
MSSEPTTANPYPPSKRVSLYWRIIIPVGIFLFTLLILILIPVEEKKYLLPSSLEPAQELFRYKNESGIYIPSLKEEKVDRLFEHLILNAIYGDELLHQFEKPENQVSVLQLPTMNDSPGRVEITDNELLSNSLLYVALPAYIAGSHEAGQPVDFGYAFEIVSVPNGVGLDDILGTTVITINSLPPTMKMMNELVREKSTHEFKLRTYEGDIVTMTVSLYGVKVNAHYTLNELWKFSDMMRFDLANIGGESGGAATAYEVYLNKKGTFNKHGNLVITGAIDVDGNIRSVGGVKAKTFLAIKKSIPIMFVPSGDNYVEAIQMKEILNSNIRILPIKKLGDIEAFWNTINE